MRTFESNPQANKTFQSWEKAERSNVHASCAGGQDWFPKQCQDWPPPHQACTSGCSLPPASNKHKKFQWLYWCIASCRAFLTRPKDGRIKLWILKNENMGSGRGIGDSQENGFLSPALYVLGLGPYLVVLGRPCKEENVKQILLPLEHFHLGNTPFWEHPCPWIHFNPTCKQIHFPEKGRDSPASWCWVLKSGRSTSKLCILRSIISSIVWELQN